MAKDTRQDGRSFTIAVIAAMFVHVLLAGGLGAAERLGWTKDKKKADTVEMAIVTVKPPPPPVVEEPPPPPETAPTPPQPKVEAKAPVRQRPVVSDAPPPPPDAPPPPDVPPAPGPATDDAPAEAYQMAMPTSVGGMDVGTATAPRGKLGGVAGGKGTGTGGGGPPDSQGTMRIAAAGSTSRDPVVDGDSGYFQLGKDYPADARRLGIAGAVKVRILVDDKGRVAKVALHEGLGYGLDERALKLARTIRFKPALDANGLPVATWITWTFNFALPE